MALPSGGRGQIAGDAATLIDPGDETALAAAIAKLATDPAARADAAARGLARAASFTWKRCAELTATAYTRAILEGGGN